MYGAAESNGRKKEKEGNDEGNMGETTKINSNVRGNMKA